MNVVSCNELSNCDMAEFNLRNAIIKFEKMLKGRLTRQGRDQAIQDLTRCRTAHRLMLEVMQSADIIK